MQYSVPQFVDVEDKIIGPLGIKTFLILLAGGLLCLMYWSLFKFGVFFFVLAVPTAFVFVILAFGKFNGRPLVSNLYGIFKFATIPKLRVYQKISEPNTLAVIKKVTPREEPRAAAAIPQSRLQRLAYILDQKSAEEDRLVQSGELKDRWLNQI